MSLLNRTGNINPFTVKHVPKEKKGYLAKVYSWMLCQGGDGGTHQYLVDQTDVECPDTPWYHENLWLIDDPRGVEYPPMKYQMESNLTPQHIYIEKTTGYIYFIIQNTYRWNPNTNSYQSWNRYKSYLFRIEKKKQEDDSYLYKETIVSEIPTPHYSYSGYAIVESIHIHEYENSMLTCSYATNTRTYCYLKGVLIDTRSGQKNWPYWDGKYNGNTVYILSFFYGVKILHKNSDDTFYIMINSNQWNSGILFKWKIVVDEFGEYSVIEEWNLNFGTTVNYNDPTSPYYGWMYQYNIHNYTIDDQLSIFITFFHYSEARNAFMKIDKDGNLLWMKTSDYYIGNIYNINDSSFFSQSANQHSGHSFLYHKKTNNILMAGTAYASSGDDNRYYIFLKINADTGDLVGVVEWPYDIYNISDFGSFLLYYKNKVENDPEPYIIAVSIINGYKLIFDYDFNFLGASCVGPNTMTEYEIDVEKRIPHNDWIYWKESNGEYPAWYHIYETHYSDVVTLSGSGNTATPFEKTCNNFVVNCVYSEDNWNGGIIFFNYNENADIFWNEEKSDIIFYIGLENWMLEMINISNKIYDENDFD